MLWHWGMSCQAVGFPSLDSQVQGAHCTAATRISLCKYLLSWGINWSISEKLNYYMGLADITVCRKIIFHKCSPIVTESLNWPHLIHCQRPSRNHILNERKCLKRFKPWFWFIIILASCCLMSAFCASSISLHSLAHRSSYPQFTDEEIEAETG